MSRALADLRHRGDSLEVAIGIGEKPIADGHARREDAAPTFDALIFAPVAHRLERRGFREALTEDAPLGIAGPRDADKDAVAAPVAVAGGARNTFREIARHRSAPSPRRLRARHLQGRVIPAQPRVDIAGTSQ